MRKPRYKIFLNNMVFLDVKWYKNKQSIVVVQDISNNEFKFYLGLEEQHYTKTEKSDILGIMSLGGAFDSLAGEVLFRDSGIDFEKDSYKEIFPEELI